MSRALFLLCLFLLPLPAAAQITVTVNPPFANVPVSATAQFTANVTGTSNTAVTWTVLEGAVGGSITAGGLYTAPGFPGAFHVVATSQADTTQSATANAVVPGFLVPEMRSPRTFHTATSLQDGTVLLVGGLSNDSGFGGLASAEIYNPTKDSFTLTQNMSLARCCNAAALLNNGKVLIAGGQTSVAVGGSDDTSEAELYDPATGTFTVTGSMEVQRIGHTATTLQNGKVLIAGGGNCASTCTTFNTAELYDPVSGTFSPTGNMTGPRSGHTATLLQNGLVLIAGGYDGTFALGSTELYNPVTGAFTAGPAMNALREFFSATSLSDGRVLLAGGVNLTAVPLSSADIYDSTTNTITATGNLNIGRYSHTATLLTNGQVLVAGGSSGSGLQGQAELYNPSTGTFTLTASLNAPRFDHTANRLPNGKVLIAGGSIVLSETSSAELFDPVSGVFTTKTVFLKSPRSHHTQTSLPDGRILVTGGVGCGPCVPFNSAEVYDPAIGKFAFTGSMANARFGHTATLLNNGKVLVTGGWTGFDTNLNPSSPLSSAELYDPVANTFSVTGSLITACAYHSAVLLANGQVLITGGQGVNGDLSSAEIYDPTFGRFTATDNMTSTRFFHTSTLLNSGKVLIAGGAQTQPPPSSSPRFLNTAEIFDPSTNSFTLTEQMIVAPVRHVATLLENGRVLLADGPSLSQYYDPSTGQFIPAIGFTGFNARSNSAIALLPDAQVLEAGSDVQYLMLATEIYDPVTNAFTPGDNLQNPHSGPTASPLPGGNIMVVGGGTGIPDVSATQAVDIYQSPVAVQTPVISSVTPSTLTGFNPVVITVQGSGFLQNAVVTFDDMPIASSFVSATEVTATVPSNQMRNVGGHGISVSNLGGLSSPAFNIQIQNALISLQSPVGTPLDFGNIDVGSGSSVQSALLIANGNLALVLGPISITGTNPGDFLLKSTSTCPLAGGTLQPSSFCSIDLVFAPTAAGGRNAQISVPSNSTPNPDTLALVGTGISSPNASVSPSSLSFGNQQVGTSSQPQTVTLTSTGDQPLRIVSISLSTPGNFSQTNNCPASLAAGAGCAVQVTFTPSTAGPLNNSLVLLDTAPGSSQTISLSGTGTDLAIGAASGGSTSSTVPSGQTANYNLQVSSLSFNGTANLSVNCSTVPAATCSVSPAMINNVSPAGPTPFSVSVTTKPFVSASVSGFARWRKLPPPKFRQLLPVVSGVFFVLLFALLTRRNHAKESARLTALAASAIVLLFLASLPGCGGARGGGSQGTPPNTYTVVVTATSSGGNSTLNLTLVVR